ncbi:MAG: TAT leader-containing periplasmic protein [Shewanella sp.]|nr:TAT leader-containing periplasmic protein [Shewanella sp.]
MNRRTFILSSFAVTAGLAVGTTWYNSQWQQSSLQPEMKHYLVLSVILPIFLEGALPEVSNVRQNTILHTIESIHHTLKLLPDESQQKLEQLFDLLESRLGLLLLSGSITPLILRSPSQLISMLEAWRHHYLALMNEAYFGLRELVMSSYYSNPDHWAALNYAKPQLFSENT